MGNVEAKGDNIQENLKKNVIQLQINSIEELNHHYNNGYRLISAYINLLKMEK